MLHVYRLFVPNSVEEKVLDGQRTKLEVARAVVNDDNTSLGSMRTDGVIDTIAQRRGGMGASGGTGARAGAELAAGLGGGGAVDEDAVLDYQYSELDICTFLGRA